MYYEEKFTQLKQLLQIVKNFRNLNKNKLLQTYDNVKGINISYENWCCLQYIFYREYK